MIYLGGGVEADKLVYPLHDLRVIVVRRRHPGVKIRREHECIVIAGKRSRISNVQFAKIGLNRFKASEIAE